MKSAPIDANVVVVKSQNHGCKEPKSWLKNVEEGKKI